jgi:hypothetical protein
MRGLQWDYSLIPATTRDIEYIAGYRLQFTVRDISLSGLLVRLLFIFIYLDFYLFTVSSITGFIFLNYI